MYIITSLRINLLKTECLKIVKPWQSTYLKLVALCVEFKVNPN